MTMIHSISGWNFASSPNYETNVDKSYPYSEVPYIGNYKLVKIPSSNKALVEHVDFWGEGKIQSQQGISGFADCYNVNHQYQLVSNGPDRNKKIPNRIPTISYTNCDTSSYIEDNSVKIVTLMGAPINKSCAQDMARIVNSDVGTVVIFGFTETSADAKNIDEELAKKNVFYCPGYKLPEYLEGLTLFQGSEYRAYLNVTDLSKELFKSISAKSYDNAVKISKTLDNSGNGTKLTSTIIKLIEEQNNNVMSYAYKISTSDVKEILTKYFPVAFKLIFMAFNVRLVNKMYMFTLKMDEYVDIKTEGVVKAESSKINNNKSLWRLVPLWDNDEVYFNILNLELGLFLALAEENGNRKVKGVIKDTDATIQWSLHPLKVNDEILYIIMNRQFKQILKLEVSVDSKDERLPVTHDASMAGQTESQGWLVVPQ